MSLTRGTMIAAALASVAVAAPASARPWGAPGWGGPMVPPSDGPYGSRHGNDPRESRVEATTFVANSPNISALGHGPIVLASGAGSMSSGLEDATFESALVDQLAKAGYLTNAPSQTGGQIVEYVVSHDVVEPQEPPHNPVSGEVAVGVGNRGSAVGLGVDIDLSKPLKALVATRLEVRIRDTASHELLWEGRAQVITREGDSHWTTEALAARLSAALFRNFPHPS